MNTNIELKDEISVDEYKAWLTGLLRGKGSQLPDLKDWKAIKKMTDKIVPDVVETTPWTIAPTYVPPATFDTPSPLWWENQPTCGGTGQTDGDNITISNENSSISFDATGDISISSIGSIELTGGITTDGISIGSVTTDYGSCYSGYSASHASSYAPPATVGYCTPVTAVDDEEVGRNILEEIRRRSESTKVSSPKEHKFDTSKYTIVSSEGEDLSGIAKIVGFKK